MAKYEVFLPAAQEGDFNLTLKVDADNWMAALKIGLKKLGEQGARSRTCSWTSWRTTPST
jgi:hypothetical protein